MLTTPRLNVVVPLPDLSQAMATYVERNRQHHASAAPARAPEFYTEQFWKGEIPRKQERARAEQSFEFILLDKNADEKSPSILGDVSLTNIVRGNFLACYLGYDLDVEAVGRGLMTEALHAVIDFAFLELKLHRIMANYVQTNARSYLLLDGVWQDHVLTSLVTRQAYAEDAV